MVLVGVTAGSNTTNVCLMTEWFNAIKELLNNMSELIKREATSTRVSWSLSEGSHKIKE